MIAIHSYQSDWQNSFQEIAALLHQKLGNKALRIDHIGSTSIPGLAAEEWATFTGWVLSKRDI